MSENPAKQIWESALGELQLQVNKPNYRTWLEGTVGVDFQNGNFVVGVPNTFVAEYLEKNQNSLIEKTLIGITRNKVKVVFQVNDGELRTAVNRSQRFSLPLLNYQFTFDAFVVGDCNRLAHAAAMGVIEQPGLSYCNPLFIYGAHGLGKTHLLQAICHSAMLKHLQVLYVSAEQFTNEFVNSIREHTTAEFREKYRHADMLLVDDIRFICGKEGTEESFFHTFNELHDRNCQIAVTSYCPPRAMPMLDKRLCSRFEGGLVTEIKPPDFSTRLAILQNKSLQQGVKVEADVLEYLAHELKQNIRELEGSLNRILAGARLLKAEVSREFVQEALGDFNHEATARITPELVISTVAHYFKLEPPDLAGKKRDKDTSLARHFAIYLLKQTANCTLTEISKEFGGRYPSTVARAYEKIEGELAKDATLKHQLCDLQAKLKETPQS